MGSSPSSPPSPDLDCDMRSFRLLSESDEDVRPPKRKRVCFPGYNPDASSSSDIDPSWNYRKKYLGGDDLPDGVEWDSDLEEWESGESEDDSFTTEEIGGMTSDSEILFAKPVGSPMKLMRFEQRLLKAAAKGTSTSGGKSTSPKSEGVEKEEATINGKGRK